MHLLPALVRKSSFSKVQGQGFITGPFYTSIGPVPDLVCTGPVASYGAGPSGGEGVWGGSDAPFATWSGTGWYRYAICGGTFNLCIKIKLSKFGAPKCAGP